MFPATDRCGHSGKKHPPGGEGLSHSPAEGSNCPSKATLLPLVVNGWQTGPFCPWVLRRLTRRPVVRSAILSSVPPALLDDALDNAIEAILATARSPRSLAGNPDSPQAVVFLPSIIDELVSIETYYVHYHVISDWNTSVLRSAKPSKWLSGQTSRERDRRGMVDIALVLRDCAARKPPPGGWNRVLGRRL